MDYFLRLRDLLWFDTLICCHCNAIRLCWLFTEIVFKVNDYLNIGKSSYCSLSLLVVLWFGWEVVIIFVPLE